MNCPHCKNLILEDSPACEVCGASVSEESPTLLTSPGPPPSRSPARPEDEAAREAQESPTLVTGEGAVTSLPSTGSRRPRSGVEPPGHGTGSTGTIPSGARLGSRYEIVKTLGVGGMGVVYRARDLTLGRDVALKIIRADMLEQQEVMDRFRREILLASRVTHKNILRIHDLGESDGLSYISMAYIEGEDLKDVLDREGALPLDRALSLAIQICQALQAAHEAGVVHRDLKPRNIMIDKEGIPYIADFGISRSIESGETLTQTGMIIGTIDYMSPEQARGEVPDHRTDIYAFGLILYEMLAGNLPFRSPNALSTMMKRIHEDVPSLRDTKGGIPPWLSTIVKRATARDLEDRYQTAAEMLHDLETRHAAMAWRRFLKPRFLLRAAGALAIMAVVAVGLVVGARFLPGRREAGPITPRASLAVLPFRNATGDPSLNWIASGLPGLIRTDLQQARALNLAAEDRVQSLIDTLKISEQGEVRPDTLRRISTLLGVDNVLTGSLLRAGNQYRIEASVQRVAGDAVTPGPPVRVEGQGQDALFAMVDDLTGRIRDQLGVAAGWGEEDLGVTELSTSSVEALGLYQEGRGMVQAGNLMGAVAKLATSLERDPNFAVARALLAETYDSLGQADKAKTEADRAAGSLRNASSYEAARVLAVRARLNNDLDAAEKAYRSLVERSPNSSDASFELASFLEQKGDLQGALSACQRVVELDPKHANGHFALGRLHVKQGNPAKGLEELNTALGLQLESGNEEGRATVLNGFGVVYQSTGRYDEAMRYFQDSLAIREKIGDRRGSGDAWNNIAVTLMGKGKFEEALDAVNKALAIGKDLGDSTRLGQWYSNLGDIYEDLGRPVEALAVYEESLKMVRQAGDEVGLGLALANVGYLNSTTGNYTQAFFFLKQALERARQSGDQADLLKALNGIGSLEQIQGRFEEALKYSMEALSLAREMDYKEGLVGVLANLSNIQEEQGEYGPALASIGESEALAREVDERRLFATCLTYEGSIRRRLGDSAGAGASLEKALEAARSMNRTQLIPEILIHRGALQLDLGKMALASGTLKEALSEAAKTKNHRLTLTAKLYHAVAVGDASEIQKVAAEADSSELAPLAGWSRLALANLYLRMRRPTEALQQAELVIKTGTPMNQRDAVFQAHHLAGRVLQQQGSSARATEHYRAALDLLSAMRGTLKDEPLRVFLGRAETLSFVSDADAQFDAAGLAQDRQKLHQAAAP